MIVRSLRRRTGTSAVLALALLTSSCGFTRPADSRITGAPDTGVAQAAEQPSDGLLAGGGVFRLGDVTVDLAECDQKPPEDPTDIIRDPLRTEAGDTVKVAIDTQKAALVAPFLADLELRSSPNGTTAVVAGSPDPSQSLPWAGLVTRGRGDRFFASSLSVNLGDRSVDLDVEIPRDDAVSSVSSAPGTYSVSWRESASLPAWLGDSGEGTATCVIEGDLTMARSGSAPVRPGPPAGRSEIRATVPQPSGQAVEILDLMGSSTWHTTDTGDLSLVGPGGRAIATGSYILSGEAWLFELSSALPDRDFAIQAWKDLEGMVRGTLLAGGGAFYVELAG